MNDTPHIMISIYAESASKQALLTHYTEGHQRRYHHQRMVEELRKLVKEIEDAGLLEDIAEVEGVE
jgi:hypothetical protein